METVIRYIRSIPRRLGMQDPPHSVVASLVLQTFKDNVNPILAIYGAVGAHTRAHLFAEFAQPLRWYILRYWRKHGKLPEGWHRLHLECRPIHIAPSIEPATSSSDALSKSSAPTSS
jgi:hypothetical protein